MKTRIMLFSCVVMSAFGLVADLNGDCVVDMNDLVILLQEWLQTDENCLMALGPELVTNGTFDADSDWNKIGGHVTISDGKANWDGVGDSNINQSLSGSTIGKKYQVVYTISNYVSGSVQPSLGITSLSSKSSNGTYSEIAVLTVLTSIMFTSAGELSIDDVSVKEVVGGLSSDMLGQFLDED